VVSLLSTIIGCYEAARTVGTRKQLYLCEGINISSNPTYVDFAILNWPLRALIWPTYKTGSPILLQQRTGRRWTGEQGGVV